MISTEQQQNNPAQNDKINPHLSEPVVMLAAENQQLKNENAKLKNQLVTLQTQLDWLREQLKIGNYRQFKTSSETSRSLQMS